MNIKSFNASFSSVKTMSGYLLISNVILVVMLSVSLFFNASEDTIIVNNLNEACLDTQLSKTWMNDDTHKRVGFYLSSLLGNITPDNAKYVDKAIMPFVAPEIYQEVKDTIALQLAGLIEDEITMSFVPETFLKEGDVIFVTGKGEMIGVTGKVDKFIRTYEFEFAVSNYTPTMRYIDVYNDRAHDSLWQEKQKKAAEKAKEKRRENR